MRTIPNSGQSYLELVLELQRAVLQFSEHPCFDSAAFDQLWTQAYALDGIAEQINDLRLFEDLEPQISESRKLLQNLTLQLKGTLAGVPDGELSEGLKRLTKQSFPRAASTYEYSIYKNLLDDYSSREMSVDNSLLEKLPAHFKASFLNDDKLIRTSFKPLLELLSYCDATEAAKLLTTLKAAFNKNDLEPLVAILLARELQAQNLGFKNYFAFKNYS